MGVGDWIMATGEVKKHFAATGRRVAFIDWKGRHHWNEIFDHNPKIISPSEAGADEYDVIHQGGGERPYIEKKLSRLWVWKPYRPVPGEIFLTEHELTWGRDKVFPWIVLIEPYGKQIGHNNKRWPEANWGIVVRELARRDIQTAQIGPSGTRRLPGTHFIETPTFRHAAAIMAHVRAAVLPEGGLHHLAAVYRTPAVVLWSEFISPEQTGYDFQTNLRHAGPPCGMRVDCDRCRKSLAAITPDEVVAALLTKLKERE